ncbi:CLUMA_CG019151, isoform A [Clunio marinus]|uniref:CLUMA_CG019151, isoform A n=1 Tax=Clunio marinus TaxID=568069 RepID=A0A1J1J1I4_9DIPT|nr:CLUMA_CG019151, isoform A [Clunio marinus]
MFFENDDFKSTIKEFPQIFAGLSAAGGAFALGAALKWPAPAGPHLNWLCNILLAFYHSPESSSSMLQSRNKHFIVVELNRMEIRIKAAGKSSFPM